MVGYGAVVLAGGAGRRLGGAGKVTLPVVGVPMLVRVLAAVEGAAVRVVVGPESLRGMLPAGVLLTRETPPGGGPVAALAAGLTALDTATGSVGPAVAGAAARVVVLAADLPLLTAAAVGSVLRAVDGHDGAVFVDDGGRRQWLCGAWDTGALRHRLAGTAPHAGRSLRELFGPMRIAETDAPAGLPPPWYDCDTAEELAEAHRLWQAR